MRERVYWYACVSVCVGVHACVDASVFVYVCVMFVEQVSYRRYKLFDVHCSILCRFLVFWCPV